MNKERYSGDFMFKLMKCSKSEDIICLNSLSLLKDSCRKWSKRSFRSRRLCYTHKQTDYQKNDWFSEHNYIFQQNSQAESMMLNSSKKLSRKPLISIVHYSIKIGHIYNFQTSHPFIPHVTIPKITEISVRAISQRYISWECVGSLDDLHEKNQQNRNHVRHNLCHSFQWLTDIYWH